MGKKYFERVKTVKGIFSTCFYVFFFYFDVVNSNINYGARNDFGMFKFIKIENSSAQRKKAGKKTNVSVEAAYLARLKKCNCKCIQRVVCFSVQHTQPNRNSNELL